MANKSLAQKELKKLKSKPQGKKSRQTIYALTERVSPSKKK